jgi:hypothetical protein
MELVTFESQQQEIKTSLVRTPSVNTKNKKRGRKQIYTSKSVPFNTSIPEEAVSEVKNAIESIKKKYKI